MRLLSSGQSYISFIETYDELMKETEGTTVTQAAQRGDLPTIYVQISVNHNSFLPKTVRKFKSRTSQC